MKRLIFLTFFLLFPTLAHGQVVYELACPPGSQPVNSGAGVTFDPVSGKYRANLCVDALGTVTQNAGATLNNPVTTVTVFGPLAPVTLCKFENQRIVDSANTCGWAGSDVGGWLNSAYGDCPTAPSVCKIILANPTPLNFTTNVLFTTKGKYLELESLFPCVVHSSDSTLNGGCLNFTTTSGGAAITMDYFDTATTNQPVSHGIKRLTLINNGCFATGSCGSATNGIVVGNTNGGINSASMRDVSIYGFNRGYINTNITSPMVHWDNPIFQANSIAKEIGTNQEFQDGGVYAGNGRVFFATASTTAELHWTDIFMFGNTTLPNIDFTGAGSAGSPGHFFCVNCHFENGAATNSDMQFVAGNVDMYFSGGTMGDDSSSGTGTFYVSCSGTQVHFSSVEFAGTSRTVTNAVVLNSPCRAAGNIGNFNPVKFTTFFGGANAANNSVAVINGNTGVNSALKANFEAGIATVNCSSSASPAVCGAAPSGSFTIPAAATTVTVNTTAVTANSQIIVIEDDSLGAKLGVTCNTATSVPEPNISARVAGTSFSILVTVAPVTNPKCYSYNIIN